MWDYKVAYDKCNMCTVDNIATHCSRGVTSGVGQGDMPPVQIKATQYNIYHYECDYIVTGYWDISCFT